MSLRWPPIALQLWQRLGWPGALAAVLSVVAGSALLALPQHQARLDAQRAALGEQRLALKREHSRAEARASEQSAPTAWVASLPDDRERQARTAALLSLATEQGLPWPRTEFRYRADRELGLAQYRIAMSLAGSYDAVRAYIAEALRRDPALALESVRLRREGPVLSAELAWVLHMQAGASTEAAR